MARITGVEKPGISFAGFIMKAVRRKLGKVPRPLRIHALSPKVLRGYGMMESAQEGASSVPRGIKKLAQVRVATRIGCPF